MTFAARRKIHNRPDTRSYGEHLNKISADFYTAMYDLYYDNQKDHPEFCSLGLVLGYGYV